MSRRIVAIVSKYARPDGTLEIGGIETYVSQLARALGARDEFIVCQPADREFELELPGVKVLGCRVRGHQQLTDRVVSRVLSARDILLFSSEQLDAASAWQRSLVIQHGIYWDLPVSCYTENPVALRLGGLYKAFDNHRNLRRIRRHRNVVCVDHAYSVWLRAIADLRASGLRLWTIPNHADDEFFAMGLPPSDDPVGILFARRFMRFRGTREFARVAARLLQNYPRLRVTLCGEGPDAAAMREILPPSQRATYCKVEHENMPALLAGHHIAVVPSLGSEGTSLSAIEGMAAGRAVVASAVGGIPNVILDGFNGMLVPPGDEADLYRALKSLLDSPALRLRLGEAARSSSAAQLGFTAWAGRWRSAIDAIDSDSA